MSYSAWGTQTAGQDATPLERGNRQRQRKTGDAQRGQVGLAPLERAGAP